MIGKARTVLQESIPSSEAGTTAVEYALIVGLIAVVVIVVVEALGFSIRAIFSSVVEALAP